MMKFLYGSPDVSKIIAFDLTYDPLIWLKVTSLSPTASNNSMVAKNLTYITFVFDRH